MLGWMLKRGDNASNAVNDVEDTTEIEQPDTPAPVFAARAFRSALFGSPRRTDIRPARTTRRTGATSSNRESDTPSKPAGILLTPGTGTTKRKRVSFGYDVPGQKESTARRDGANRVKPDTGPAEAQEPEDEDEWEEEDEGDRMVQDVTLDLNEPQSRSGRYWKEEFNKYHEDARAELEKLVKYKQLTKSYAKQKDAEALQLAEQLRDEQIKVLKMEKMIAENTSNIATRRTEGNGEATELVENLASQTALVTKYREEVERLENKLEEALEEREQRIEGQRRRRQGSASPATHKALAETQRELRQAKGQLREMGTLRDQVSSLKAKLQAAREQSAADNIIPVDTSRTKELRNQIRMLREESMKKDQEMLVLRTEFEAFRQESAAHDAKTSSLLERAQSKMAELKKEIKTLKAAQAEKPRPQSWPAVGDAGERAPMGDFNDPITHDEPRRSLDVDERRPQLVSKERRRSLRDKFREDAPPSPERMPTRRAHQADDRAKWQEFVPRAPHNLDYLGEDVARRIENGGVTPAAAKKKNAVQVEKKRRASRSDDEDGLDLLRARFAKLGGPEEGGQGHSGISIPGRINLPPERRAAALARIEKRMAEKKRARARNLDKENIRPIRDVIAPLASAASQIRPRRRPLRDPPLAISAKSTTSKLQPGAAPSCISRTQHRLLLTSTLRMDPSHMASHDPIADDQDALEHEVAQLEAQLQAARSRLQAAKGQCEPPPPSQALPVRIPPAVPSLAGTFSEHFLLLLSDSALPVGSFAFSSGLESFLAHSPRHTTFSSFLPLSLSSFASTTLPFVLAAYRDPNSIASLDDQLDAAIVCTVGRRASTAQGRALLSIWERSFRATIPAGATAADMQVLRDFSTLLRQSSSSGTNGSNGGGGGGGGAAAMEVPPLVSGHFAPLFGAVCAIVGLSLRQTAYVFMLSHVKALVSAAVRASMFGPYQAQKVLAGESAQEMMNAVIEREWETPVEEAGQSVPVMDLWIGRHEVLYSRIFNS